MAGTYLLLLTLLLAGVLGYAILSPDRIYQYPYFMAAAFVAFILPQAYSLVRFPFGAQPEAIDTVLLMTLLCILACIFGYRAPVNQWIVEKTQIPIDDRRLFRWGVFFVLCGFFFTYLISGMTVEERGGGQWTGRATIYLFFATLGYPGLAICLRQSLKNRRDGVAWFWTIAGSVIPVVSGLFHARREPMALLALTIAITLYFQKRYMVPRTVVAAALVLATIAIPATSQVRATLGTRGIASVWNVDFVGNFKRFISGSSILELRNAAMLIQATNLTGDFGFGKAYWDQLVFRFVPAQIVGRDIKESLMFRSPKRRDKEEIAILGYRRQTGTTVTGVGDSYREFGYFGALFFAALAVVFKSLWHAGLRPDGVFAQLLYIQTATSAMHAVTHQTADYLPALVYNLVFLGSAVYFSRVRRPATANMRTAIPAR
jgi:oligosaccharide repeat unit polymerase